MWCCTPCCPPVQLHLPHLVYTLLHYYTWNAWILIIIIFLFNYFYYYFYFWLLFGSPEGSPCFFFPFFPPPHLFVSFESMWKRSPRSEDYSGNDSTQHHLSELGFLGRSRKSKSKCLSFSSIRVGIPSLGQNVLDLRLLWPVLDAYGINRTKTTLPWVFFGCVFFSLFFIHLNPSASAK